MSKILGPIYNNRKNSLHSYELLIAKDEKRNYEMSE